MNALELIGIRKRYEDRTVLAVDRLEVASGERVALVGHNGGGKTTLLWIAALLLNAEEGQVKLFGEEVTARTRDSLRRKVHLMASDPYFFRMNLLANLLYPTSKSKLYKEIDDINVDYLLGYMRISHLSKKSPRTFSTGERRRAALVRALIQPATLLLLDEPFAGLDALSTELVAAHLAKLPRERTLVFATHDLALAHRLADRVLRLEEGRLLEGPVENLLYLAAHPVEDGTDLVSPGGLILYTPQVLPARDRVTVTVDPREILLSRTPITSSAQNVLAGTVRSLEAAGPNMVLVGVDCIPDLRISVSVTNRAVSGLALEIGSPVYLHIKATSLRVHEVPA